MKRIYISDLDGTLLTSKKILTEHTISLLKECIQAGALFSVATARMPYGCDYRLEPLHLNVPSILTNGVFLYDFSTRAFLGAKTVPAIQAHKILDVFAEFRLGVFLYTFSENQISVNYNDPKLVSHTQYYSARAIKECRTVTCCGDLDSLVDEDDVVYFACTGPKEKLEPVKDRMEQIEGIACAFYLNIYNGLYCMELFSGRATKKNALLELKKMLGCSEVVVFGDNLNDLSMMEVADRSYVVENGLEEVKAKATGIIPGCDQDGVADFIHKEVFGY